MPPGRLRLYFTASFDRDFTGTGTWADGAPTITISAPNASPSNVYVRGATLNGRAHGKSWLSEQFVTRGGNLVVDVTATPDTSWGTTDLPVDHVPAATTPVPTYANGSSSTTRVSVTRLGGSRRALR